MGLGLRTVRWRVIAVGVGYSVCLAAAYAQQPQAQSPAAPLTKPTQPAHAQDPPKHPTKDDLLRGPYGPYRANNDLLFYHLTLRVDPEAKTIAGTNLVRFRMLADGQKIQLELTPELTLDAITSEGKPLTYTREERSLFIDLPHLLKTGEIAEISVAYHGRPVTQGCFSFDMDKQGKPWITTACEGEGASVWWPNKDQWLDEPQDGMEIDIAVPNGLMDVSNGRFVGSKDLGDGYTEWQWRVHYPINNYDVALNIGDYQHWDGLHINKETGEKTTLDFYALPEDLDKAKAQFAQVPTMLDAYEHYFGEYPFDQDGYKLIEVPYAGMEHQTAVAYGNRFENGYYGRDWTKVGISPKFDFIIIHESGHEWFGNAITAADKSDMWIHEGWTTYMEALYVEYRWGKADAIKYVNGRKPLVDNKEPIVTPHNINKEPARDQYDKAALMLNTLRSVIDGDTRWFADIHDFYQHFKYRNIMTEDVVAWWSTRTGMDLRPFFDEYLRHTAIPTLELTFAKGQVSYQYKIGWSQYPEGPPVDFAMPIKVGDPAHWTLITPTANGKPKSMPWAGAPDSFQVATDLYYVNVAKE